jgi:SAM-dependent methyltransferase
MTSATESFVRDRLSRYSFYHVIEVQPGLFTPGIEAYRPIQKPVSDALQRLPLRGKRVLDIGCRDGLFSFESEDLGAAEVIGIDNDLSAAAVEFLIPFRRSRVKMAKMNLMDLTPAAFGKFDVVIFAGVLYHLRYPFFALKLIRDVMNDGAVMVLESGLYTLHEEEPLLFCPVGSASPYEATSVTFFNLKGLTGTLRSFGITVKSHHYLGAPHRPHDRCTLVCEFRERDINPELVRYWDGTHRLNSDPEANRNFLAGK